MKHLLAGVTADFFRIGKTGPAIYHGDVLIDTGSNGDIFLRTGANASWYTRNQGTWEPLVVAGAISAQIQTVMRGIPVAVEVGVSYVGVSADTATADNELILSDSLLITADLEPQAFTEITLPSAEEGMSIVIKDEESPAGDYPIIVASDDLLDGQTVRSISLTGGALEIIFSGGEWRLVGQ